jgi:septal ring factor EnvC (AmiA/AmiB activator)
MQSSILMFLLLICGAGLCSGQKQPEASYPKQKFHLDARLQVLEEKLKNQQFELDQLKKELRVRDDEIRALTELIEGTPDAEEGTPDAEDDSQQQDNTFAVETGACRRTSFVRFLYPRYLPGKANGHFVRTIR